jgi:Ca2+-binding RTX toxin-like protein
MSVRLATILLSALLALLLAVPVASAAAAEVEAQDASRWIRLRANDGEVNKLTLSHASGAVTVADSGADLTAGPGCEQVGPRELRCTITGGDARVDVSAGDGDDEVTVLGALPAKLDGEAGNDVLTGGDAVDKLDGGEGDDTLNARDSVRDSVVCDGGQDVVVADVEDEIAPDCETLDKPLPPAGMDDVAPPGPTPAPAPTPARSVAVAVKAGTVLARTPGASAFAPLDPTRPVPVGTVLDTRNGVLTLTAAADRAGATQAADFKGGRFTVGQRGAMTLTTDLRLTGGDFSSCPRPTARRAVARAAARRVVRKLWGSGKGRFRTRGRNSAATVRGTVWQVEDRCDGTLTRVTRGVVVVENLRTGRTKVVRAGQSHLVRRRAARR